MTHSAPRMPSLAVLISGNGSNLQALLDACDRRVLQAKVDLVVSNRRDAYGLVRAQDAGVATLYFPLKPYVDAGRPRADYDLDLARRIEAHGPDLIVLAGWMHVLSPAFLHRFPGRVINLHPALPGRYPGTRAIERAFDAFRRGKIRSSGCMVHYVVAEVDAGPVIASAEVALRPDDTLDAFAARMHEAEHALLVEAVELALAGPEHRAARS